MKDGTAGAQQFQALRARVCLWVATVSLPGIEAIVQVRSFIVCDPEVLPSGL